MHNCVQFFTTPWTAAGQAPPVHGIFQARTLEQVAISYSRIVRGYRTENQGAWAPDAVTPQDTDTLQGFVQGAASPWRQIHPSSSKELRSDGLCVPSTSSKISTRDKSHYVHVYYMPESQTLYGANP